MRRCTIGGSGGQEGLKVTNEEIFEAMALGAERRAFTARKSVDLTEGISAPQARGADGSGFNGVPQLCRRSVAAAPASRILRSPAPRR